MAKSDGGFFYSQGPCDFCWEVPAKYPKTIACDDGHDSIVYICHSCLEIALHMAERQSF